jgi:ABC-2 type transport system ATP-binding protein
MLTGLLQPTAGHASVAGFDIVRERASVKQRIGYMSQRFSLYGDLTVLENIRLFAGLYGVTGDRLLERESWILEMAELNGRESRLTALLALGWKQRLALGCAVLHEPPILFLDEPTSGVDPVARRRFWDLIDDLSAAGTTVFVSTHYMEEAEHCHRLALMNRGRLVALDTPAALRNSQHEPVFRIRTDDAARAAEFLAGADGVLDVGMFGRHLHVTMQAANGARERVAAALAGSGTAIHAMDGVAPSLEDVFVSLVRREGGAPVE